MEGNLSFFETLLKCAGYKAIKNSEYDKLYYAAKSNYSKITTTANPKDQFDLMKSLIVNEAPVIFDVGAYIGSETKKYLSHFNNATIHAFEPFSKSYSELVSNTIGYVNVVSVNAAVSDKTGVGILKIGDFSPTNSLLDGDKRSDEFWGTGIVKLGKEERIKSVTIDQYCTDKQIEKIDILKLDVQGMELAALLGGESMLKSGKVSLIILEALFVPTYVGQADFGDVYKYLISTGYILYNVFNLKSVNGRLNQADVMFTKENVNG